MNFFPQSLKISEGNLEISSFEKSLPLLPHFLLSHKRLKVHFCHFH